MITSVLRSRFLRTLVATSCVAACVNAWAQADCTKLGPELQGRCELVNLMRETCANARPDARKNCEKQSLQLPTREDCTIVAPAARELCEQRNRTVAQIERCRKLTGADLQACLRSNASQPGYRQL